MTGSGVTSGVMNTVRIFGAGFRHISSGLPRLRPLRTPQPQVSVTTRMAADCESIQLSAGTEARYSTVCGRPFMRRTSCPMLCSRSSVFRSEPRRYA